MGAFSWPAALLLAIILAAALVWWIVEPHFTTDPTLQSVFRTLLLCFLAIWTLFFLLALFGLLRETP